MLEKIPTEMTYVVQTPHFHFGHVGDRPFHRFVMPGLSLPLGLTEQTVCVTDLTLSSLPPVASMSRWNFFKVTQETKCRILLDFYNSFLSFIDVLPIPISTAGGFLFLFLVICLV